MPELRQKLLLSQNICKRLPTYDSDLLHLFHRILLPTGRMHHLPDLAIATLANGMQTFEMSRLHLLVLGTYISEEWRLDSS